MNNEDSRTKREELKTYAELKLKRTLKSARQRRRLVERAAQVIVGSGEPGEPLLAVRRDHYNQARLEVLEAQLRQAQAAGMNLPKEALLDHFGPRIEREVYRQLLAQKGGEDRLEAAFVQTHGRGPTQAERVLFAPHLASTSMGATVRRAVILDDLLGAIESRRTHSAMHLQSAWAEAVGGILAQQTHLEKIEGSVAYFRCMNAALRSKLVRQTDLPTKLARLLKIPVNRLQAI